MGKVAQKSGTIGREIGVDLARIGRRKEAIEMAKILKFRDEKDSKARPSARATSNIEEILALARKVLESENGRGADTLEANIRSIARTVEMENRLTAAEKRLKTLEKELE